MSRILSHREFVAFIRRARSGLVSLAQVGEFLDRLADRQKRRGPSKLARRMRRKQQLGRAGAF